MSQLSFPQENLLQILKFRLDYFHSQDEKLDHKAQQNIQSITIILAIAGAFKVFDRPNDNINLLLMAVIFVIYLVIAILVLYVTAPKKNWIQPIKIDLTEIRKILNQTNHDYYETILLSYYIALDANQSILALKEQILRFTNILTGLLLICTVILVAK